MTLSELSPDHEHGFVPGGDGLWRQCRVTMLGVPTGLGSVLAVGVGEDGVTTHGDGLNALHGVYSGRNQHHGGHGAHLLAIGPPAGNRSIAFRRRDLHGAGDRLFHPPDCLNLYTRPPR